MKERRFDVLKTYVKTSFFRAFMSKDELKCSIAEYKARLREIDSMSLSELEKYSTKCSTCGNWFLKDNKIADETYRKVSLKWAEAYNKANMKR